MRKQKGYLKQTNVWSTPRSGEGKGGKYLKMEKLGQEISREKKREKKKEEKEKVMTDKQNFLLATRPLLWQGTSENLWTWYPGGPSERDLKTTYGRVTFL